jgi:cytochrome P450
MLIISPRLAVLKALGVAQSKQMLILALAYVYLPRSLMHAYKCRDIAFLISKSEYLEAIRTLDRFVKLVVAQVLAWPENELEKLSSSDERLEFLHSIAQQTRDPKQIRDEIMSVLIAGWDTTAATLSWVIYEICGYPTAWAKIRQEVLDVVGPDEKPTYDTLKNMTYLGNVVNETLRLHPAVPFDMREALETALIPGNPGEPDIVLLKGDTVVIHTATMQAREDMYPPESETFARPSMFSPERCEHWAPKPWAYIPFHGGPRMCFGQDFALTEIMYCCGCQCCVCCERWRLTGL